MAAESQAADAAVTPRPSALLPSGRAVLLSLLAAYVAAVAIWPLARLFLEALAPGEEGQALGLLAEQWGSRATLRALRNTVEVSVLSAVLSVVLGTAAAAVVMLSDIRARSAAVFVLLLPLLIPSQITALAWIELTGSASPLLNALGLAPAPGSTNPLYSKWGIILVMGIEHAGLVFLAVRAGLYALPRDLVEAARLGGARPPRIVRSVLLPLALPSILSGAALAFVASIGNFGVPALLGIPGRYTVLTTLIYQRLQGFGPSVLGEVAAISIILAALAALGLLMRAVLARTYGAKIDRSAASVEPFPLGRARIPFEAAVWVVLLVISVLPLIALVGTALLPALGVPLRLDTASLANFRFVLFGYEAAQRAFANSFVLAAASAAISATAVLPLAYFAVLERNRVARLLDVLADAPYAVPGTVLGIAMILVFLPPIPGLGLSIYNTGWIILIAYLARFLALAARPAMAAMEALDPALDEAARISGARILMRLRAVILPVIAPSLAAGGLLIFMQAFNELTVSALLWSSGWETLGVVVFFLHREGNSTAAAALATLSLLVTVTLAIAFSLCARWLPRGVVPWRA